jgi:hypothetical protein
LAKINVKFQFEDTDVHRWNKVWLCRVVDRNQENLWLKLIQSWLHKQTDGIHDCSLQAVQKKFFGFALKDILMLHQSVIEQQVLDAQSVAVIECSPALTI